MYTLFCFHPFKSAAQGRVNGLIGGIVCVGSDENTSMYQAAFYQH